MVLSARLGLSEQDRLHQLFQAVRLHRKGLSTKFDSSAKKTALFQENDKYCPTKQSY